MEDQQENGAAAQAPQVKMTTLTQFVRDLSFENILAQKGIGGEVQPDVTVQVNLDAKKRSAEHQYEVITKLKVESVNKEDGAHLFLMELDYVGVFHIEGVPEDQLHPFLMIECPRMLFPFLRRIVSDVTRDGGFPPLLLDPIDFGSLYMQQAQQMQTTAGEPAGPA